MCGSRRTGELGTEPNRARIEAKSGSAHTLLLYKRHTQKEPGDRDRAEIEKETERQRERARD